MKTVQGRQLQLELNFDETNIYQGNLTQGKFVYSFEYSPEQINLDDVSKHALKSLSRLIEEDPTTYFLTLTDNSESSLNLQDEAAFILNQSKQSPMIHLAGRNKNLEHIKEHLAIFLSQGFTNILSITGDKSDTKNEFYTDSLKILSLAKSMSNKFYTAVAVNPFKYNAEDSFMQYFKMVQKINSGADYIISHHGWDMKKYQELLLYLQKRDICLPVIARIKLLKRSEVKILSKNLIPGVSISRELLSMFEREAQISYDQFKSVQYRRAGLQAAGCYLMGYNGIQFSGIKKYETAKRVLSFMNEYLEQYPDFHSWTLAWNEFHQDVRMTEKSAQFYIFKHLLEGKSPLKSEEYPSQDIEFPVPHRKDLIKYHISKKLLNPQKKTHWHKVIQTFLIGCSDSHHCDCQKHYLICKKKCPKHLQTGPCGGSQIDGTCEMKNTPCIFRKKFILASYLNELDKLEEKV